MIVSKELIVDGVEVNCEVDFSRYRETSLDEAQIVINSIRSGNIEVSELVSADELESLKERCERSYQNNMFDAMIERNERTDHDIYISQL